MVTRRRRQETDAPEPGTRGGRRFGDVAVLNVGTPNYAKDLVFSLEVGIAYCDGRPTASWLIEPEDKWGSAATLGNGVECGCLGGGLKAALVAKDLWSATRGFRVFSRSHVSANEWLNRLATSSGVNLDIEVRDFQLLLDQPAHRRKNAPGENLEWAKRWAFCSVPETQRLVVHAARDVAFLRELVRMTRCP